MPNLSNTPGVFELLEYFFGGQIRMHPSVQVGPSTESFSSCSGAVNWKPFVIGIIAPDNPVDFIPIRRIKQEIEKAEMPPTEVKVAKSKMQGKSKSKAGPDGKPVGSVVPISHKNVPIGQFRQSIVDAVTRKNGGVAPPRVLLDLITAQALTETGGVQTRNGQKFLPDSLHPPNFNFFGYHDTGVKPPTYAAKWVESSSVEVDGQSIVTYGHFEDDAGNKWSKDGLPIAGQNDGTIGILRGKGNLVFAPKSGKSSLQKVGGNDGKAEAFYNSVNRVGTRFLGTDTEDGFPYISSYTAFNSNEEAVAKYVDYLYDTFPDIKTARTPEEFNYAIQHGIVQEGITRKFHDTSAKVNKDYVNLLTAGVEACNNSIDSSGSLSGAGADATDDPSQKILAYGSSMTPDDPLASVFGRNIQDDRTRMRLIENRISSLNSYLAALRSIPPLILLVNPQEFKRAYENVVDYGVKTRVGNLVHTWFEQPMKINVSGVTAAQYAIYADKTGGLTGCNRVYSLSYRNLLSLLSVYKSNGNVYDTLSGNVSGDEKLGSAADGSILMPGAVYIHFDDHLYIGSFDNFSITDDKPYNMGYSFSFTVRRDIHTDIGVDGQLSVAMRG